MAELSLVKQIHALIKKKGRGTFLFARDYYAIIVNSDGSIASFYKRGSLE